MVDVVAEEEEIRWKRCSPLSRCVTWIEAWHARISRRLRTITITIEASTLLLLRKSLAVFLFTTMLWSLSKSLIQQTGLIHHLALTTRRACDSSRREHHCNVVHDMGGRREIVHSGYWLLKYAMLEKSHLILPTCSSIALYFACGDNPLADHAGTLFLYMGDASTSRVHKLHALSCVASVIFWQSLQWRSDRPST